MIFLIAEYTLFNPFIPNAPFLYTLKASENCKVIWCFQGVEKRCIGDEWVTWEYPITFTFAHTPQLFF